MSEPATSTMPDAPVDARIEVLDVLRAVAVGGIMLANVLVFFGLIFRPPNVGLSLPARGSMGLGPGPVPSG